MQENENIEDSTLDSTGGGKDKPSQDKKDIWDIIGAVGRFLGSVVAAGAMVFVAYVGWQVDERTAAWDQTLRSGELLAREAELQSSRESAANQLRGSVSSSVGQSVAPLLSDDDRKLALLAGLHTNFGAIYDTRPVFAAFSRDIKGVGSRQELKRLAKRAALLQVESLPSEGGTKTQVEHLRITYPTVDVEPKKFTVDGHDFHLRVLEVSRKYGSESSEEVMNYRDASDDTTDDVTDSVFVAFSEVDIDDTIEFELSYMDSPYIDNVSFFEEYGTHHKLAFVLREINEVDGKYEINIDVVHFPAGLIPTYRVELPKSVAEDQAEDASHMD